MKDEIEIDGKKYLNKEKVEQDYVPKKEFEALMKNKVQKVDKESIELFPTPIEAKLYTALNRMFNQEVDCVSEAWAIKQKEISVLDPANICMMVAKTDRAKLILRRYMNFDMGNSDVPKLDYKTDKKFYESKCSSEYLSYAMLFFTQLLSKKYDTEESVMVKIQNDFPIQISNSDFVFILAPRIEDK